MPLLSAPPKLGNVARRLEGDLLSRGLRPGDRYLTVADAATMLSVSPATAHRAMDLLVKRRLLVRQHGRGTFIGEGVGEVKTATTRSIILLTPEDQAGLGTVYLDAAFSHGIQSRFKGVQAQFCSVPLRGGLEYVRERLDAGLRSNQVIGVVARSCSREIYRYLGGLGVPVVVVGSLYADQRHLPSVDLDYRQIGRLLTQHLVAKGHRSLALLMAGDGRPGDTAFYGGVSDVLAEAGLPHNALTVRIFPRAFDAFRAQVREVLAAPERPTAIICGLERLAGVVVNVADSLGLSLPNDVEVVFHTQTIAGAEQLPFVHTEPKESFFEISERVADMLERQADGRKLEQERVVIEVRLRNPPARPEPQASLEEAT